MKETYANTPYVPKPSGMAQVFQLAEIVSAHDAFLSYLSERLGIVPCEFNAWCEKKAAEIAIKQAENNG